MKLADLFNCAVIIIEGEDRMYRNLVIFCVENISYVIISCSFNFVRSPYHYMKHV